ncbi:hypothetical protein LCGC14_0615150 [marine sediment metagenome]|uniref:Uncharacterized protein n=1 Tax=marine sediment metagenome TaxID=412755 RepID=A0A0F9R6G4_9ZZZZ
MASIYELADEIKGLLETSMITMTKEDLDKKMANKQAEINSKVMYLLGFIEALKERKDD